MKKQRLRLFNENNFGSSIPAEDLGVAVSVNNMTPGEGATIFLYVTVTNRGRNDMNSVVVTAPLPAGYTYVDDDSAGNYDDVTGVWDAGNVAYSVSKVLEIEATVDASGSYAFTATLTSPSDDVASNNVSTVTPIPVPPPATDIEVTLTADNNVIDVGEEVTYTLTIHNYGPTAASGLVIDALLPSGVTYVSDDAGGDYDDVTGEWTIGALASGADIALEIVAEIEPTGSYDFTASLNTVSPADTNAANDSDTCSLTAAPVADMAVDISTPSLTPITGTNIVLTFQVSNAGPSSASSVEVTGLLPAGLTYVSKSVGTGSYNQGTGVWTVGSLASGASASMTVTATVEVTGSYVCSLSITDSSPDDFNAANATDSLTLVPIVDSADISVDITADDMTPYYGQAVVFTVTVDNDGLSNATGVEITALLPSGFTYTSSVPSVGSYNSGTGVWTLGNLANGASATLTVTANTEISGSYAYTASVTDSSPVDLNAANDSDTVTPTAAPIAPTDISGLIIWLKSDTGTSVIGGELTKTAGSGSFTNSLAYSAQGLTNVGDYFEYESTSVAGIIGLYMGSVPTGSYYQQFDYAINTNNGSGGAIQVLENNSTAYTNAGVPATVGATWKLQIVLDGNGDKVVAYYKNGGSPFYTSAVLTSNATLYPCATVFSVGQTIADTGSRVVLQGASPVAVEWTSLTGFTSKATGVATWANQVGGGVNFQQTTVTSRPAYIASEALFNNLPAVNTDSSKWIKSASNITFGVFTGFIVFQATTGADAYMYAHHTDSNNFDALTGDNNGSLGMRRGGGTASWSNIPDAGGNPWSQKATAQTICFQHTGTHATALARINGSGQTLTTLAGNTGNPGTGTIAGLVALGAYTDGVVPHAMKIAEFLLYPSVLTALEIKYVENYLRAKYGHY